MRRPRSTFRLVEDAQEPGAHVGPGREGLPAPKCPRVRLLHQVFCLLAGSDKPSCDPVDLVGELQSLLLETDAIARLARDPPGLGGRLGLAHRATVPVLYRSLQRALRRRYSRSERASRKPARPIASRIASRDVRFSSQERVTSPMSVAFANSSPSWPRSACARRPTQRSQRIPLTWTVSRTPVMARCYRPVRRRASTLDAVNRTAGRLPRVVRRARPEARSRTRPSSDSGRPPSRAGRAREIRVVTLLPHEHEMSGGHEDRDERAAVRRARERIGADAEPAIVIVSPSSCQRSSSVSTGVGDDRADPGEALTPRGQQ